MRIPALRTTIMTAAAVTGVVLVVLVVLAAVGVEPVILVVLGVGVVLLAGLAVVASDLHHTHRDLVRLTVGLRTQLVAAQRQAEALRAGVAGVGQVVQGQTRLESSVQVAGERSLAAIKSLGDSHRIELTVAYHQLAALMDLHGLLPLRAPLPATRSWAASPDVLARLVVEVEQRRPLVIVECGSGVSSVVLGYAVQKAGVGRVVSLEHDAQFAEETRENLRVHGLLDVVEVRDAPLVAWSSTDGAEQFQWYDLAALEDLREVGLVFVDGPPGRLGPQSRYPAAPALLPHCADETCFVLDDTIRAGEQEVSARWLQEFPDLTMVARTAEKGMHVFTRSTTAPQPV